MATFAYSCLHCMKNLRFDTAYRGKPIVCQHCQHCQILPISLPVSQSFLPMLLFTVVFMGLILMLQLKYQHPSSRLDFLKKEVKVEMYHEDYSKAIYYYVALQREVQRERVELKRQLARQNQSEEKRSQLEQEFEKLQTLEEQIPREIKTLQKRQLEKNKLSSDKGIRKWKRDFPNRQK